MNWYDNLGADSQRTAREESRAACDHLFEPFEDVCSRCGAWNLENLSPRNRAASLIASLTPEEREALRAGWKPREPWDHIDGCRCPDCDPDFNDPSNDKPESDHEEWEGRSR